MTCKQQGAPDRVLELAAEAAKQLLPVVLGQLAMQNVPYDQAMKALANFSFDGEDAGTRIDKYLKEINDKIDTSSDNKLHVDVSTEAKVLDFFSGKGAGTYETNDIQHTLTQHDFKFNWEGKRIIPASLNVVVLKRGENQSLGMVSVDYVNVTGMVVEARNLNIPVAAGGSEREYWAPLPVGAVVAFFLSPDEVEKLAPQWLPALGQEVPEPSPLSGGKLPDLRDRFVLGAGPDGSVIPSDGSNVGGATDYQVSTTTVGGGGDLVGYENLYRPQGAPPKFVIDTDANEGQVSDHLHRVSLDNIRPPYRRLVYMVRVL